MALINATLTSNHGRPRELLDILSEDRKDYAKIPLIKCRKKRSKHYFFQILFK